MIYEKKSKGVKIVQPICNGASGGVCGTVTTTRKSA